MGQFQSYFADVRKDAGRDLPIAVGLVLFGAALEGIGIVAILPLAALITGNADTETAQSILEMMGSAGIETTFGRALALSAGFLALFALRGLVVWKRDTKLHHMGLNYVDQWRSKLFRAIANAKWSAVSALRRTDIEHAITSDVARLSSGTDRMFRGAAAIALAFIQLAIIAALAPMLLLLVFVLIVVAALGTMPLIRRADRLGQSLTRSGRKIHSVLGDFLVSQKLARLNNAEDMFRRRFEASVSDVRMHQLQFFASQAAARGWFQFAAGCVVIAALLAGFFLLKTPISVLVVTLLVLARLVSPIQMIAQTSQAIANTLPAFSSLQRTLTDLEQAAGPAPDAVAAPKNLEPATLTVSNVSFRYPGQGEQVLAEINFAVSQGEIVALSGASGTGKTTLLDVICGLHQPDSGTISVDGQPLSTASDLRNWRSQIAYLPQDPFLFDASLRENLIWSAAEASDDDIWDALKLTKVDDLVRGLPDGLDSRAGERGQNFSGGERQRICIARALLRRPRLLILDEATNALDKHVEHKIMTALCARRQDFSMILVSHRSETLRHADRQFTLAGGHIVSEFGDRSDRP